MKLFWTIFGAVLAAAAVIWTVSSFVAAREKSVVGDLSMLESMTRGAKATEALATEHGKILDLTKDSTLDGARHFEKILRAGRVERSKARSLAFNYVYEYREVIKAVREKIPEHKSWAEELDGLLTKIETTAASL